MSYIRLVLSAVLLGAVGNCVVFAQDAAPPDAAKQKERIVKLEKFLTGAKLMGQFTVTGKDGKPPAKEEYSISGARKLDEGDTWLITSRIKYGDKDVTVPVPLEILWAGETPVMTLDKVTIPGMGTFDARVIIHDGHYAGTWRHDAVGGLLFGTIEPKKAEEK